MCGSRKLSERESYGDSAIGYVQVKREKDVCIVRGRITPEHNVHQKCYNVTATCNETEGHILSVQCEDCAAHLGGCKHAIAFLAWLHRRSEDPPSTSVECYWKKAKLSTVGTSLKYIKAKEITSSQKRDIEPKRQQSASFLSILKNHSLGVNDMDNQLMKYFKEPSL
ncbi:unnamed protein product [Arctia plantaginis]|uniref:SWIM-type domain-containing protein n=1 Tax=Arctia plantaginis TaxID=874455 RepID=A0A8S1BFI5_ARCPL|nr:unnamed protein product [Arctia plantaginis]